MNIKAYFCNLCNYGLTDLEFHSVRLDFVCRGCGLTNISDYYANGSYYHKQLAKKEVIQNSTIARPVPTFVRYVVYFFPANKD